MSRTAEDYLNVWRSWLGYSESNGKHKKIIDLYNSHKPLARSYVVQYNDQWCDTTVSAAAIEAGMVDLIGTECGCEEHVKIFKAKGIWIEDGKITPIPGDIILYNWDDSTQPNDGYSDHIGVVEKVSGNTITCIEGNKNDAVERRTIPIGWGFIRGYARPKYDKATTTPPKQEKPAENPVKPSESPLNRNSKWVGEVTASELNVRKWAGTENEKLVSYPVLKKGNLVDVCDSMKANDGSEWYYIRIAGKIYGFASAKYIKKK